MNGACVPVTDCSIPRCNHGYCVVSDGLWRCICDEGWTGPDCNEPAAVGDMEYQVSITEAALAAILLCLLVLLCKSKYSLSFEVDHHSRILRMTRMQFEYYGAFFRTNASNQ